MLTPFQWSRLVSKLSELGSSGGFATEPITNTLCFPQGVNDRFCSDAIKGSSGVS